jgi:hypothetical protein
MEVIGVVIGDATLLDLSLPGTHDSLTYNLSLKTSDGGIDGAIALAQAMHRFSDEIPDKLNDFIRTQAQTQVLTLTQQLNNGIRFLDFRIMYEYSDRIDPQWYSLHFLQTYETAIAYLKEAHLWLLSHPQEILVVWLSKHGSTCSTGESAYPKTSVEAKQSFWSDVVSIFGSLLVNSVETPINETSIATLLSLNKRIVIYASDYIEFTGSSELALDGCLIDNALGPSVYQAEDMVEWQNSFFAAAEATKARDKGRQGLLLMSMASSPSVTTTVVAGEFYFFGSRVPHSQGVDYCTNEFVSFAGVMTWCPESLLDFSQLQNYYSQISIENAYRKAEGDHDIGLPNAIYLNSLDIGGLMRTGTQVWGTSRSEDTTHFETGYAYVATLVAYNIRRLCFQTSSSYRGSSGCRDILSLFEMERNKNPLLTWNDPEHGRLPSL